MLDSMRPRRTLAPTCAGLFASARLRAVFVPFAGLALATALAACGPGGNGDAGGDADASDPCLPIGTFPAPPSCPAGSSPCDCAERTQPYFCHDGDGQPSATATDAQQSALVRANHWRTAAGLPPLNGNAEIEQAATAHANFMATTDQNTCWPGVHNEVNSPQCPGFTGAAPWDRMSAAGYQWSSASEVINWENTPSAAVDGWIWTVYHREPFLEPTLVDTGYGLATGPFGGRPGQHHNVMDFGTPQSGAPTLTNVQPAVFPLPGQINVPAAFHGNLEGPTPPPPGGASAWDQNAPSGTVISIHFPNAHWLISDHHLYLSDPNAHTCMEVEHTFFTKENDQNLRSSNANAAFMYANSALQPQTEYVVDITGTFNGADYHRTWAFTTQ